MAQAQVDTRNLEWKDNNVGSKLLQKMGWKDGQAIGKRRLLHSDSNVSSEGLRVRKRANGLGLGASSDAAAAHSGISHAADFTHVLQSLQEAHGSGSEDAKRRKKSKKSMKAGTVVAMPTNKTTHAKVRQAKFQQKSAEDMKCIFAGADIFASISAAAAAAASSAESTMRSDKKRRRKDESDNKASKKKKKKKEKKEVKSKKSK